MIETRATYKNSVNQECEQEECRSYSDDPICERNVGWTDLLDDSEYEITALSFRWLTEHSVETYLKGRLKARPETEYEAMAVTPVINEM